MPIERDQRSYASAPTLPRRGFLTGAAALPLVAMAPPAVAAVAPPAADRIVDLYRDLVTVIAGSERTETDEEGAVWSRRWAQLDQLVRVTPPTTLAGAVAAIEWARQEHVAFNMLGDETNTDPSDSLLLTLFDGALGALRGLTKEMTRG